MGTKTKPFTVGAVLRHKLERVERRPIHVIARDIESNWPKPYFGAVPYINAMHMLVTLDDRYLLDSARSVVLHFLTNAQSWRGADARRVKAELKRMMKLR